MFTRHATCPVHSMTLYHYDSNFQIVVALHSRSMLAFYMDIHSSFPYLLEENDELLYKNAFLVLIIKHLTMLFHNINSSMFFFFLNKKYHHIICAFNVTTVDMHCFNCTCVTILATHEEYNDVKTWTWTACLGGIFPCQSVADIES